MKLDYIKMYTFYLILTNNTEEYIMKLVEGIETYLKKYKWLKKSKKKKVLLKKEPKTATASEKADRV